MSALLVVSLALVLSQDAAPPNADAVPVEPMRIGNNTRQPKLLNRVEPAWPELVKRAGISGRMKLEATVGRDGRIQALRPLPGSQMAFRDVVVDAVRQWRYAPLRIDGKEVPFVLTVTITYFAGGDRDVEALTTLLQDEDPEVRASVASYLSNSAKRFSRKERRTLAEALRRLLEREPDEGVKLMQDEALARLEAK